MLRTCCTDREVAWLGRQEQEPELELQSGAWAPARTAVLAEARDRRRDDGSEAVGWGGSSRFCPSWDLSLCHFCLLAQGLSEHRFGSCLLLFKKCMGASMLPRKFLWALDGNCFKSFIRPSAQ